MGYTGRRVQLLPRALVEPCSSDPFLDLAHAVGYLPTLHTDSEQPGAAGIALELQQLVTTVEAAHAVFLSPGGGLLVFQSGSPRQWQVRHARSGSRLCAIDFAHLHDARNRLARGIALTLSDVGVHAYVEALEGLVDPRGQQIDWTADLPAFAAQIRDWQDYDAHGTLPEPGSGSRFGGFEGLHLAALLHAVSLNPMREAASGHLEHMITTIVGHDTPVRVRDRTDHGLLQHLRSLDRNYNHGRRQYRRDRDWRTRTHLSADRTTGKIVSLARLLTVGGQPHRAVALLRDHAELIQPADADRTDGLHSTSLTIAARMIAETFSPIATPLHRLRHIRAGDQIVEADDQQPGDCGPSAVWRVRQGPQHLLTDPEGHDRYQIGVRELLTDRTGTIYVRTGDQNPLRVAYDNSSSYRPETIYRTWVPIDAATPIPRTSHDVLHIAEDAVRAFDLDDPDHGDQPPTTTLKSTRDSPGGWRVNTGAARTRLKG